MKSTGIVRKVDELGRVVLPIELRKTLDFSDREALEIFTEEDTIVLRKYTPGCAFCGSMRKTINFRGKLICDKCVETLKGV